MTFGVPKNNGSGGSTTNTVLTIDEDGDTTFTGDVTLTGASADIVFDKSDNALEFATNAKAVFGSSLSISRIGNSSYIHETGSGDLYIKGSDIYITDQDNNQFIHLDDDGTGGTVRLKHEGSTKLSTTSTGVDVTGVLAVNSGTTDTAATFTSSDTAIAVNFVASDNSMQIATSGTDGIIKNNGAGSLRLFNNGSEAARINSSGLVGIGTTSPSSPLEIKSSATNNTGGLRIIQDSGTNLVASLFGGVNSGTRFGRLELSETSGDAINVRISADPSLSSYINSGNFGIGTSSPATPLEVRTSSDTEIAAIRTGSVSAKLGAFASGESRLTSAGNDGFLTFYTGTSSGEKVRIDSSGRVGIGTSSPSTSHKLTVSGDTKFTGQLSILDNQLIKMGDGEDFAIYHDTSAGNVIKSNTSDMDIVIQGNDGGSTINALKLDMSNNGRAIFNAGAGFSDHVNFDDNAKAVFGGGDDLQIYHDGSNSFIQDAGTGTLRILSDDVRIMNAAGTEISAQFIQDGEARLKFDNSTKLATKTGGIEVTGNINNTSGDMTIDVAGNIVLDADGGQIQLTDAGTNIGLLQMDSSQNLIFRSMVQDKDVQIKGNDGGSTITALTFDMSNAGAATFNGNLTVNGADVTIPSNIIHAGDTDTYFGFNDANTFRIVTGGSEALRVDSSQNLGIGTTSPSEKLEVAGKIKTGGQVRAGSYLEAFPSFSFANDTDTGMFSDTDNQLEFSTGGSSRLSIDSSGQVGIGTSSPDSTLHIKTSVDNSVAQGLVIERSANTDKGYINYNGGAFQIRSTVGDPIAFGETDAEHMRIAPDGNIGIGTSSPSEKLEVAGNIKVGSGGIVKSDTFNNRANTANIIYRSGSTTIVGNNANALVVADAGNVGIGKTSPTSTLEVAKSDRDNGVTLTLTNTYSGSDWATGDNIGTIDFRTDDSSTSQPIRGRIQLTTGTLTGGNWASPNQMAFSVADGNTLSEAMRIDNSGNVGIGTTAPDRQLSINDFSGNGTLSINASTSGASTVYFADGSSGTSIYAGYIQYSHADNSMQFATNGGSERMRIDSGGNVGIGLSPSSNLTLGYVLRLFGGSQTYLSFNNSTHTTQTTGGFVIGNDASAARITQRENQPIIFDTNNTERMRINSSGGVGINTTSVTGPLTVQELSNQVIRSESTGSGTVTHLQFVKTSGGAAQIGSITGTTSSVSYNTTSDYRLKENVITDWNATTLLKQLKPSKFNFKDNQSETVTGFIAHEIQEILPYLVSGEKDGEDMQSMDYAKLTPLLTKAIQEQQAIIEDLQTQINNLRGK